MKSKPWFWIILGALALFVLAACARPISQGGSAPDTNNPSPVTSRPAAIQPAPGLPVPTQVPPTQVVAAQAQPATLQPTAAADLSKEADDLSNLLNGLSKDLDSTDTLNDVK